MKMDPGAILLVVAADHLIPDADAFAPPCAPRSRRQRRARS